MISYKSQVFDPYWVTFCLLWNRTTTSFFYIWIYSWSSTICWKNYSFHIELSWQFYWKSANHRYMSLFLDFQFYSIDWYVYFFMPVKHYIIVPFAEVLKSEIFSPLRGLIVLILICSYSSRWFYLFWDVFLTCKS